MNIPFLRIELPRRMFGCPRTIFGYPKMFRGNAICIGGSVKNTCAYLKTILGYPRRFFRHVKAILG